MKILITGGQGQLGRALAGAAAAHEVHAPDVAELDIRDREAIAAELDRFAPVLLINAAAYTAVDRAESERELAHAVNAEAPGHLSRECAARGIRMLHVSTDFVFDGAASHPYREDDPIAPLGVYGETKAAGEQAVIAAGGIVVRTAWLFAAYGAGFVQAILRAAKQRSELRVVDDQRGSPTWAGDLADALLQLAQIQKLASLYHYCGEPAVSRHALALAIVDEARRHGPLACEHIVPVSSAEFPTPARRPANSALATDRIRALGIVPRDWHAGLARVVADELA